MLLFTYYLHLCRRMPKIYLLPQRVFFLKNIISYLICYVLIQILFSCFPNVLECFLPNPYDFPLKIPMSCTFFVHEIAITDKLIL